MTPSDLCTHAARRANIIAHSEQLSDSELSDAVNNLNGMLSMMSMERLLADNGVMLPLGVNDAHTGLDDQLEYALIDLLAVRLAGVYGLSVAPQIAKDAQRAETNLKRWNAKPLYHKPDLVLLGLS